MKETLHLFLSCLLRILHINDCTSLWGSNELSLNYVLLIIIVLRKLSTPVTLEIAYIHNGTVISILISANWFIFSRPGVPTRRKKESLKKFIT